MITVIESPHGVRLNYNGIEVFNHTDVFPFIKFTKGNVVYGAKKGKLTASLELDCNFAATDYKVVSAGAKSANIEFSGYGDCYIKINCVEEKDRLVLYFNPSSAGDGLRLTFLSNALETVMADGKDIKGKRGDNLSSANVSVMDLIKGKTAQFFRRGDNALSRKAAYYPLSFLSDKGISITFDGEGYAGYDLTVKTMNNFIFATCPKAVIIKEDGSIIKDIADNLNV